MRLKGQRVRESSTERTHNTRCYATLPGGELVEPFRRGPARLGAAEFASPATAASFISRIPGRPGPSGSSEWPGIPGHSLLERVRISGAVGAKAVSAAFVTYRVASERGHTRRVDSSTTVNVPAQLKALGITRQRGLRARGLPVLLAGLLRGDGRVSCPDARFPGGRAAG